MQREHTTHWKVLGTCEGVALAVFVLFLFMLPSTLHAYFGDEEASEENVFGASSLGIALTVTDETSDSREVEISADREEDIEYRLVKQGVSGDLCDDVEVEIMRESTTIYDGLLSGFASSSTTTLAVGDDDAWTFDFDGLNNTGTCMITFAYEANQSGYAHGEAFFDTEIDMVTLQSTLSAPNVVLNEVLPNPIGDDTQDGAAGEWVELYNNGSTVVDLDGWKVADDDGNERIIGQQWNTLDVTDSGVTTIPGSGWLVVYFSHQVLNNDGDIVCLYDDNDVVQDCYSYGINTSSVDPADGVTPGGSNGGGTVSGGLASGQEGKSDARIPDGVGIWVDPVPTPGAPNTATAEELRAEGWSEGEIDAVLDAPSSNSGDGSDAKTQDDAGVQAFGFASDAKNTDEDTQDEEPVARTEESEEETKETPSSENVHVDEDITDSTESEAESMEEMPLGGGGETEEGVEDEPAAKKEEQDEEAAAETEPAEPEPEPEAEEEEPEQEPEPEPETNSETDAYAD